MNLLERIIRLDGAGCYELSGTALREVRGVWKILNQSHEQIPQTSLRFRRIVFRYHLRKRHLRHFAQRHGSGSEHWKHHLFRELERDSRERPAARFENDESLRRSHYLVGTLNRTRGHRSSHERMGLLTRIRACELGTLLHAMRRSGRSRRLYELRRPPLSGWYWGCRKNAAWNYGYQAHPLRAGIRSEHDVPTHGNAVLPHRLESSFHGIFHGRIPLTRR